MWWSWIDSCSGHSYHSCPASWAEDQIGRKRVCSRSSPRGAGCVKATFDVDDIIGKYSRVCGRIVAYKYGTTEAFAEERINLRGLDNNYLDGVSITHGSTPIKHIWSFAAGSANPNNEFQGCPCDISETTTSGVPFINEHFFCESVGSSSDALWDGSGCEASSSCCSFNDPPYFSVTLEEPTCDNIDVRLCGSGS